MGFIVVADKGLSDAFAQASPRNERDDDNTALFKGNASASLIERAALSGAVNGVATVSARQSFSQAALKSEDEKKQGGLRDTLVAMASRQFQEKLQKRLQEIDKELEKLNREIYTFRDIQERIRTGGLSALTPEDHAFLQEQEPRLYKHWMETGIHEEREAITTGDTTKIREVNAKHAEEAGKATEKREETKKRLETAKELIEQLEKDTKSEEILSVDSDGNFTNLIMKDIQKKSGKTAKDLASDGDTVLMMLMEYGNEQQDSLTSEQNEPNQMIQQRPTAPNL